MSRKEIKKKKVALLQKSAIKSKVAKIPDTEETRLFSIGFKHFDDGVCVLKSVDAKVSRKLHEVYRSIGKCSSIMEIRKLHFDIKPISNKNHYSKYFKNVTDDVEVNEFDIGQCRGFFFCDQPSKIIQILAIDHHPEDKKNKKK